MNNDWTLDFYSDDEQHLYDFETVLDIIDIYNDYVSSNKYDDFE